MHVKLDLFTAFFKLFSCTSQGKSVDSAGKSIFKLVKLPMSESDLLKTRKSIVLQGREILQTFVWSGANKLSPPPPPIVTPCYLLLPLVTSCYPYYPLLPLLPLITPCYPCYTLFQFVTPITLVTPSYPCYPLLPLNTPCYPLYPLLSYFEKIAHMSVV